MQTITKTEFDHICREVCGSSKNVWQLHPEMDKTAALWRAIYTTTCSHLDVDSSLLTARENSSPVKIYRDNLVRILDGRTAEEFDAVASAYEHVKGALAKEYIWKREVERIESSIPAQWGATAECPHSGTIAGLSVKGCLVKAVLEELNDETVFIRFELPTGRQLLLQGEVIYFIRNTGFAVQFTNTSDEDKAILALLVSYHLEDQTP